MRISIIIPIYNANKYINNLITALKKQTFNDFEALFVDNCSTDHPETSFTSINDSRFKLLRINEKGVSKARNFGIEQAKGDLLTFVDADDLITPDYLTNLFEEYEKTNFELIISDFLIKDNKEEKRECFKIKHPIIGKTSIIDNFILPIIHKQLQIEVPFAVWGKLFMTSIAKTIKFEEDVQIGEDALFMFDYMSKINTISFVAKPSYIYIINYASSLHSYNKDLFNMMDIYLHKYFLKLNNFNVPIEKVLRDYIASDHYFFVMKNEARGNQYKNFRNAFQKYKHTKLIKESLNHLTKKRLILYKLRFLIPSKLLFKIIKR